MNKKVIVVGAGASGLMAAGTAAKNGNDVILFERSDKPIASPQNPSRHSRATSEGRQAVTV